LDSRGRSRPPNPVPKEKKHEKKKKVTSKKKPGRKGRGGALVVKNVSMPFSRKEEKSGGGDQLGQEKRS